MSYVDRAPVGETCPSIDKIISKIEVAINEAEFIEKVAEGDYENETDAIIRQLNEAISDIEKIRQDNASLREWGNKAYELLEESESARQEVLKQCDILEQQLEKAVLELQDLKEENEDIAKRYWQLEDKYSEINLKGGCNG